MTKKEFLQFLSKGTVDVIGLLLEVLRQCSGRYCLIGGLGVNAYVSPVVSLDLDIVVITDDVPKLLKLSQEAGFTSEDFKYSPNLSYPNSELRIQIQTDARYQEFVARAAPREVMSYILTVAAVEDVLQGKVWAYLDSTRRKSKRQKDLADITRLVESYPQLELLLPEEIKALMRD